MRLGPTYYKLYFRVTNLIIARNKLIISFYCSKPSKIMFKIKFFEYLLHALLFIMNFEAEIIKKMDNNCKINLINT
jgi:hypothetical protein